MKILVTLLLFSFQESRYKVVCLAVNYDINNGNVDREHKVTQVIKFLFLFLFLGGQKQTKSMIFRINQAIT